MRIFSPVITQSHANRTELKSSITPTWRKAQTVCGASAKSYITPSTSFFKIFISVCSIQICTDHTHFYSSVPFSFAYLCPNLRSTLKDCRKLPILSAIKITFPVVRPVFCRFFQIR
ncbi:unnamed protein product [Phytomonas sp. Hart1]|nr:unnamed protein product [Phytomonas sp. Hart1]|eukprot:CCW68704.1 unnamed protein product [Phytomonas sp. isolate Hart1]